MTFLPPASVAALESVYPRASAVFRHGLADHPLLSLAALEQAARELPSKHVERRISDAANGGDFAMDLPDSGDVADTIAAIGSSRNWIMLRFVEQLPRYRDLVLGLLDELGPAFVPLTGPCETVKAFVFVSAPGTLTPFHFDAEYNILFQISGDKAFAVYPPQPPFLSPGAHESYHRTGDNMLPWEDEFETRGTVHRLTPGDALYVPYAAPHWVRAGATPSVSLSVTWQNEWSRKTADAIALNPLLRRLGLPSASPPIWPETPTWRALGGRAARRVGLL
ncbi:cupin-like domain-containing protein [Pelagerythrobacter rhizovicinus]|uniref:Transcription factor jumonji, JmjC n=1 Tax=Pelagerythrobacter rhizovicinus TaxID=2268576 RepID=A0A4Q2KQI6_9SPHN|nr:cupin-like domain-containing protein [Pelagerythrobacter rhizovicinus]RXZ65892.1 transcription factor jumonji, JmjC [Pelagerythrobacter rhizovicinus]